MSAICQINGCDEPQVFPDGPCRYCIDHSLHDYFSIRPLMLAGQALADEMGAE